MRVGKAKRRWMRWARYVAATGSEASGRRAWGGESHDGQAKAYQDVMYARRAAPRGVRVAWYPQWIDTRGTLRVARYPQWIAIR